MNEPTLARPSEGEAKTETRETKTETLETKTNKGIIATRKTVTTTIGTVEILVTGASILVKPTKATKRVTDFLPLLNAEITDEQTHVITTGGRMTDITNDKHP